MNEQTEFLRSPLRLYILAIGLALISIILSILKGSTSLPLYQLLNAQDGKSAAILWDLRIPRTLSAFVCGGLLALSGSLMQLLVQNPLADPYALGISGGAAFVTLLLMLFGIEGHWLLIGGWGGSLISIVLIFLLAKKHRWQSHLLLLAGIALSCGFAAGISAIIFLCPADNLHGMMFWLNGDLSAATMPWLASLVLFISLSASYALAPGLNLFYRGEKEAASLGLNIKRYRIFLFLISSLLTACAVSLAGCIGFIGLIIPHMSRMLSGYDLRKTLPLSVMLGGSLLTIADMCARILFAPQQIPVGILMAFIGVPMFIWLIQK